MQIGLVAHHNSLRSMCCHVQTRIDDSASCGNHSKIGMCHDTINGQIHVWHTLKTGGIGICYLDKMPCNHANRPIIPWLTISKRRFGKVLQRIQQLGISPRHVAKQTVASGIDELGHEMTPCSLFAECGVFVSVIIVAVFRWCK
jgi:hypothetical protein